MAKRSALDLFEYYYQALMFSLPMKDHNFMEDLFKHDLLTGGFKAKLEGLSVNKERATCLLDSIIKAGLAVGDKTCFISLLTVMNNSKYDNVKDLAKQIESEYDADAKCDTKPKESDLFTYIVPKVAKNWRDLGVLLEIPNHHLDTITVNNTNHPVYIEQCCKAMLQKWMEITTDLSWDKLQKCISCLSGLSHNDSSENTTLSSAKLSISTSVDALYAKSTLTYDEAADICLADDQTKIKLLNDKLAAVSSKLKLNTTKASVAGANISPVKFGIPQSTQLSAGFNILKSKYKEILKRFPKDFCESIHKLKHKLSDDQICSILNCSSFDTANKMILDYLIEPLKDEGDLLDLCDQLDRLTDISPNLKHVITELRKGLTASILPSSSSAVMVNTLPLQSSLTPVLQLPNMEYKQKNFSVVSQPSSLISIVSDTHTITSPVTTLSVVECLTTSSSVTTSTSVVTSISGCVSTVTDIAAGSSPDPIAELPKMLYSSKDFSKLKAHYHTILHLMPDDYEPTVGKLQDYFSDDQIADVLSNSTSTVANKTILDCLIERINCREELLDLCDQLEKITNSDNMRMVTNEIRLGLQQSIEIPVSTSVATNTQSLLSSDQQHHSLSPSVNSSVYQTMLSQVVLDPTSKVLAVLKKNYTKLWQSLPQDYMKTIIKLQELKIVEPSNDKLNHLINLPTADLINENILANLIMLTKTDTQAIKFCDIMEYLVDSASSQVHIEILRNEVLEALSCSSPVPAMTTQFTTTQISTSTVSATNSQQFHRSTTVHHTASVSSVVPTTTNVNSVTQSKGTNTAHHSPPGYLFMLSHTSLNLNSKVLAVLKKNYTTLCHCLPQNYMKTINELRLMECPDDVLSKITNLPTTDLINGAIVGILMIGTIKTDVQALQFCDVMDKLIDNKSSKTHTEILRNEILEAFSSSSPVLAMTTESTTTQISTVRTTDNHQFSTSTTIHHTSSVLSVEHTTPSAINISQLPQRVQQSIQLPISTTVTTTTQSLLSSDQQHYSTSPSSPNNILFNLYPLEIDSIIGCIESVIFDKNGKEYFSSTHGVKVTIPPGAISGGEGKMILAASLFAPIEVTEGFTPVSAMIWLCTNVELQKSISLCIPHFVNVKTDEHSESLSFLRTENHSRNNQTKGTMMVINGGTFPKGEEYGIIEIDHFCYYCIANNVKVSLPVENVFNVVTMKQVQPNVKENLWEIHVCILPNLPSCEKGLKQQYENEKEKWRQDKIIQGFSFKSLDQCIQFKLFEEPKEHNPTIHLITSNQKIQMNEVDFTHAYNDDSAKKQLRISEELKNYPPRFKFEVSDTTSELEYFKKRRHLVYKLINAKEATETKFCDKLSIPPYHCASALHTKAECTPCTGMS